MNKTKIDWCDMTWNPVTGCWHECEYCYARRMAQRLSTQTAKPDGCIHDMKKRGDTIYPFGFDPTLHRYRLDEPTRTKKPRTIFVCSMADLFGEWVPDEWIEEVFAACAAAPQHQYIFLTKNPGRYIAFNRYMPSNMWFGWSQTKPGEVKPFDTHHSWNTFASVEPIHEPFPNFYPSADWVIIGAESGNRCGKVIPEKVWIADIAHQCTINGIPVFMKESLRGLMGNDFVQEFPWEEDVNA